MGGVHNLLATKVPQSGQQGFFTLAQGEFGEVDTVGLVLVGVEFLVEELFHQRGLARRTLADEHDLDLVEGSRGFTLGVEPGEDGVVALFDDF